MVKTKQLRNPERADRAPVGRPTHEALYWADFSDQELLRTRMCDLDVRVVDTPLEKRVERLDEELQARGISFRPHCWLSDEWFSPDGVPGIAIPFYLAHPRLARLERKQMLDVEGGTEEWCMRILRHEAGHAIDVAFRLHLRRSWRETFGKFSQPYPEYYDPKPYSKSYVRHLDNWYAQSHPTEDFAETFAVWLKPRSRWRSQYRGWPVIRKLEYVERLMAQIAGVKPTDISRRHVAPLRQMRRTLAEHYQEKRARYGLDHPDVHDRDLRRVFSDSADDPHCLSAATFLRSMRRELRRTVAKWTGEYQYTIDQVLDEIIQRCEALDLKVDREEEPTRGDMLVMLTVQTMEYLHGGHHRLAL